MPETPRPQGPEDNMPKSPQQELLHGEFAALGRLNSAALENFDPNAPGITQEHLGLWTSFPEIEVAEPEAAFQYHVDMVDGLGLGFHLLEPTDPEYVFQHTLADQSVVQVRLITRADGERIPVKSQANENGVLTELTLMTHAYAAEDITTIQGKIERRTTINGLIRALNITDQGEIDSFQDQVGTMDTHDLQGMLASLKNPTDVPSDEKFGEQIRGAEEAYAEQTASTDRAIRTARRRYAKSAMPSLGIIDKFMRRKVGVRATEYINLVEHSLRVLEYHEQHVEQELAKEQGLRHAELNRQLRKRKTLTRLGAAAITGVADAFIVATGAGASFLTAESADLRPGAGVGLAAAAAFSLWRLLKVRKNMQFITGFTEQSTAAGTMPLIEQLSAEIKQGGHNSHISQTANDY